MSKKFKYKYSAPTQAERKEIEYIQSQYQPTSDRESKIQYLRKLDNKVKGIPACVSLILGIGGLLIFGLGLTMILEWNIIFWGVILCLIGCIPMALANFAYNYLYNEIKNKYSAEILEISRELLNEE